MNLKEQICSALCAGFTVKSIPIGYVVRSPFSWFTGDKLSFYMRRHGRLVRFEESGSTLFDLEAAGVDLATSGRLDILDALKREHGVSLDDEEALFHTDWVPAAAAGLAAIAMLSFLQRVQDLSFTNRTRTASTFREDLIRELEARFSGDAEIVTNEAPVPALELYVVDIIVKHRNGRTAAIFPATSEQKALEAVLFAKELELKAIDNVVPFLVFENVDSGRVSRMTNAKAMNSELLLASWEGGQADVLDKVAKRLAA